MLHARNMRGTCDIVTRNLESKTTINVLLSYGGGGEDIMPGIFSHPDLMTSVQSMYVWSKRYDILNGKQTPKDVYFRAQCQNK